MSDLHDRIERLESLVEQQQATIDEQRDRIADLEAEVTSPLSVSRRTALKTGGLLALLGGGSQAAAADPSGHLGSSSDPLTTVYTERLAGGLTGGTVVEDLLGTGLTTEDVGGTTELRAAVADTDADGLLEPTDGSVGIDVTEVYARSVFDSGGNSHLRLQNNGPLKVTQPLDIDGNAVADNGTTALSFDGNANTTVPSGRTLSVDGSLEQTTTVVSSDYTTGGEARIAVETSGGAVTITLASADAVDGRQVTVVDKDGNASTNAITVQTEGGETINPGGVGSKQLTVDGGRLELTNVAGDWYSDRNAQRETVAANTLIDTTDDGSWETLRELGYESGDAVTVAQISFPTSSTFRTSKDSYQTNDANGGHVPLSTTTLPPTATVQARMVVASAGTMDADGDYKLVIDGRTNTGSEHVETPAIPIGQGNTYDYVTSDPVVIQERGTYEVDYYIRSHVDGSTVSLWQCTALIEILLP